MTPEEEIAQLEAALQKLITGTAVAEVEYENRRVRYQPADIAQLRDLVSQKKAAAGLSGRSPARRILF
jgi:hypothetical protein